MNKYQEALDRIGRNYYLSQESGDFEHFENLYLENKKTLQELVDKATPKKVIKWLNDRSMACCPMCHNAEYAEEMPIHCHYCGQTLDWSEE